MGVLDSVIRFRENEEAQRQQMFSNIVNAPVNFMMNKIQSEQRQLEKQKTLAEIQKLQQPNTIDDIINATTVSKNLIDIGESTGNKQIRDAGRQIIEQTLGQSPDPKNYLSPEIASNTPSLVEMQLAQKKQEQDLIPTAFNQFGEPTKYESVAAKEAMNAVEIGNKENEALLKGPTGETAGKVTLAKESIKNIQDVKKILFPDGTAKSFKRTTAFASNLPGGSFPILPSRGWGKAEQEVFRKMGASLSGRQLIQTGVAARPEETLRLISQFAPSLGSNPDSALNGLNELEEFYKSYLDSADPEIRINRLKGKDPLGIR